MTASERHDSTTGPRDADARGSWLRHQQYSSTPAEADNTATLRNTAGQSHLGAHRAQAVGTGAAHDQRRHQQPSAAPRPREYHCAAIFMPTG